MLQLTRDLPPAPAPIHRQSKDIVVAVHTVYVVVPSVDLLELSRDLLPSSCARLLALEYVVVGVDSPDVSVPRGAHVLQLPGQLGPRSTPVDVSLVDVIVAIHSPRLHISCVDLLKSSWDLYPIGGTAWVWAHPDLVSRVHSPDVVDRCRNVFQCSWYLTPVLPIHRRKASDKPPRCFHQLFHYRLQMCIDHCRVYDFIVGINSRNASRERN